MPRRDPRKGKRKLVYWSDAVGHQSRRMADALADNSLSSQVSPGYVSKKTKKLVQVMTTTESKETPLDEAECDYIQIPRDWVIKIEPIKED